MTTNSDTAVAILTSESIYQVKYFFGWANNPGYPVIIAEVVTHTRGEAVRLRQAPFRTAFVDSNDAWMIPLCPAWILLNGTMQSVRRTMFMARINADLSVRPVMAGAFLLFPDMAAPARTLYSTQLWATLFALLDSTLYDAVPTINRAAIQQDLGAFLRNGDVGLTVYIAGIRYMWRETSRAVWRTFAKEFREIHKMAAKISLEQLDKLVYNITLWHQPLSADSEGGLDFDHQTRPFVMEVQCLALRRRKCDEVDNYLDKWNFAV